MSVLFCRRIQAMWLLFVAGIRLGHMFFHTIEQVRRFFKILGGFTLLGLGAVMLVTPGPGWLAIFLGLTLLAAEFMWARRLMNRMKEQGIRLKDSVLRSR